MSNLLEVTDLCKTYPKATKPALDHVSFNVDPGAIYAFIGPNGAGKTTTIRIISTLLRYASGSVRIAGLEVKQFPSDVRRMFGYIPDEFGLYNEMEVCEYLRFFAACYKIPPARRGAVVDDLLDLVGLTSSASMQVAALSRGMRQRLGLARALVHDPLLIIADEPAAGLDPRARVDLREIFRALREMGKTIFLSSHVLRELDDIATHVGVIEAGRFITSGSIEQLRARMQPHHQVHMKLLPGGARTVDDAHAWLIRHPTVLMVERPQNQAELLVITLRGDAGEAAQVLADLVRDGFPVISYREERDTLESLFLSMTQPAVS